MGYSRQQSYEIRRNYQVSGAEGLLDRLPPSLLGVAGTDARAEEALRAVRDPVSLNRRNGQTR